MYEQILKQADDMIKENVIQYRETIKKDMGSFSLILKKEYESIKATTQNMLDGVADRIETTIVTKTNDSIEELKSKIGIVSNELVELEAKFDIKLEEIKRSQKNFEIKIEEQIDVLKQMTDQHNIFVSNINSTIKNYISRNSKQIKSELLRSFLK